MRHIYQQRDTALFAREIQHVPPVVQRKVDELARGAKQRDTRDAAFAEKIDQFKRRAKIDGVLLRAARRYRGDKRALDVGTTGRGRQIELYRACRAAPVERRHARLGEVFASGRQRMALPSIYLSWPVSKFDSRCAEPAAAGLTYAAA